MENPWKFQKVLKKTSFLSKVFLNKSCCFELIVESTNNRLSQPFFNDVFS